MNHKDAKTKMKTPLAEFLESEMGKGLCDAKSLKLPEEQTRYLENRIIMAFKAGEQAHAKEIFERMKKLLADE